MKLLLVMIVATMALGVLPARAQMDSREGIALQNQILELRRDLQQLRADQGRGSASSLGSTPRPQGPGPSSDITAQLLDRVDRLENAVRTLNGRLDEMDNARQRQGADLAKQIGDLQFRIDNGGAGGAAPGAPPARPVAPVAPPTPTSSQAPTPLGTLPSGALPPAAATGARRTPELALQDGNAALARRDYVGAEASAREVLAVKGSPRAYDAQFLLAQSMMGSRNYPQAAVAYGDTYDRSKQGAHAQDSLIGLAASLTAINEKRSACAALDTLKGQFPSPRPDIAQRSAALRATAGCK